ncbi:interleukin-5 receptor subunit alpha [Xenopus laevis]|uniref:Interleukin-5 receptor subunit alpha n=2 Tax=Xenopus laevis TaxID=8355 RepID=A0A1L8GHJ5_XENLA|nr:interleukin-5 receptor subunit alpha [Xenopus laevis]XP_041417637.1 interleukin-5 receptor subunit alpha [Xenopus laevis]OCT83298.1 hypothetical protein XELAEV_18025835mg [Xenopus laevis]
MWQKMARACPTMIMSALTQSLAMTGLRHVMLMFLWIQLIKSDHIQAPKEFRIWVSDLGKVDLSWRPSGEPIAANRSIKYQVTIKTPDTKEEEFRTLHTNSTRLIALHRGLHATVKTLLMEGDEYVSQSEQVQQELPPFSGAKGTAVTNLTCHIKTDEFLKTSLTCSWTAGINAPADTQYYLYYRYKNTTEKCYKNSQGEISTGCQFPFEEISKNKHSGRFLVHVNGSSKSLKIQSLQHVYMAEHLEIINPPRNMSLSEREDIQILSWDKPYALCPDCLEYEVIIWNLKDGSNKTQPVQETKLENKPPQPSWNNHVIKVRAKTTFTEKELYSNWTEPLHVVNTVQDQINKYIIAGCLCLTGTGLVLIFLCLRFQLFRKMFPPIPKPKEALKELFLTPQKMDMLSTRHVNGREVICFIEEMRDLENLDK